MQNKAAAVIGNPIRHSLSPGIFSFIANRLKYSEFNYFAHKVEEDDLENFIRKFRKDSNFVGINVTIPHKETILKFLDQLSPEVQAIGAANVVQKRGGLLFAHNTDVYGISKTLEKHHCQIKGKQFILLGAGGASRAVAYALAVQGAKVVNFINNNVERAQKVAREFANIFPDSQFHVITEDEEYYKQISSNNSIEMIINATPLGMLGKQDSLSGQSANIYFLEKLETYRSMFSKTAFAFDLIYNPELTPFLSIAQSNGLRPIGGLDMLVQQAFQTWRIWFGPTPQLDDLQTDLIYFLRNRPIFLTGFMGAGKSTVGQLLAHKLQWKFLDIDTLIEQYACMSISEIFDKKGEAGFRELESRIIRDYAFSPRTIIALGGGALINPLTHHLIEKAGKLVFLSARPSTLIQRLQREINQRPILKNIFMKSSTLEQQELQICDLLKRREKTYQHADIKMETDGLSPVEIVDKIMKLI